MIKEKRQFMETFLLELVQSVHDSGGLWAWLGVEKRTVRFETADGLRFPETGDGSSLALGEGERGREKKEFRYKEFYRANNSSSAMRVAMSLNKMRSVCKIVGRDTVSTHSADLNQFAVEISKTDLPKKDIWFCHVVLIH